MSSYVNLLSEEKSPLNISPSLLQEDFHNSTAEEENYRENETKSSSKTTSPENPSKIYNNNKYNQNYNYSHNSLGIRPEALLVANSEEVDEIQSPIYDSNATIQRKVLYWLNFVWLQFRYYVIQAYLEARKRKFNFCLGTFSIFIVVCVAAVCNTLIARAPVVFLQQAEIESGQIDMKLTADSDNYMFFNYTQFTINTNVIDQDKYSYHSPRLQQIAVVYPSTCSKYINSTTLDPFDINWKYMGDPTVKINTTSPCYSNTVDCLTRICKKIDPTAKYDENNIYLIDTLREKRMNNGRYWPFPPIPKGQIIISKKLAELKGHRAGDIVYITFDAPRLLLSLMREGFTALYNNQLDRNSTSLLETVHLRYYHPVHLAVTVYAIADNLYQKFASNEDSMILMEYNQFLPLLIESIHPNSKIKNIPLLLTYFPSNNGVSYPNNDLQYSVYDLLVASTNLNNPNNNELLNSINPNKMYEYSTIIIWNLPPNRIDPYMQTNYDDIRSALITFSSDAMYYAGFVDLMVDLPILGGLGILQMFALYLGLILSVILTILFILSTMLLYSLLMISIETRTFELGVHRMIGMKRINLVQLLLTQAISFSVPAWSLGLIASQIIAQIILKKMERSVEIPLNMMLTGNAIGMATFLGLFIPLLSAILPIRTALSKNLSDTLDLVHSKTKGVEFSIERSESNRLNLAWIVFGSGCVIFGFLIYYLLPLSLLSFNLALFFNLFFGILLGMLFGLILLSLNFQHVLERLYTYIFLCYESRTQRVLVIKNLVAHRLRNRKTSIMYALSLGFIIFIIVAYEMQIDSAKYRQLRFFGSPIAVATKQDSFSFSTMSLYENILTDLQPSIVADWGWSSMRLKSNKEFDDTHMSNMGHAYTNDEEIYALTPTFFDCTDDQFLITSDEDTSTGLSLSEQLYTVTGSQGAVLSSSAKAQFGLTDRSVNSKFILNFQRTTTQPRFIKRQVFRPLAYVDLTPHFTVSRFPGRAYGNFVSSVNFINFANHTYSSVVEIPYNFLVIKLASGLNNGDIDTLVKQLKVVSSMKDDIIDDGRDFTNQLDQSNAIMSIIFDSATYIAMGLCLFSLMASMFTNIYEQAKEISILRALGVTKWGIIRLYTYEAFILVLSASTLGLLIGFVMSTTMIAQQVLFTQLPVNILFPYIFLLLIVIGSVLCAFVASFAPAKQLMTKSIAQIMRTVL